MIPLDVDFLPNQVIADRAQVFLAQYGLSKEIPVPVEEVIEQKLNYDIVPTPNLQRDFDIEGFTSFHKKWIYVDDFVYNNRHSRYRYTLAHEVGHISLHKHILEPIRFESVVDWAKFIHQIDPGAYSKLEYQGYNFGGLVLVPQNHLKTQVESHLYEVTPLIEKAKSAGLNRNSYLSYAKDHLSSILAPLFDVSTDVVIRRLEFDQLDKLIP